MAYLLGTTNSVSQIIAGSNVTIEPTSGYGNVTINGSAGGGGGASTGVLTLAYTTGINGSGSNGNITLSNTGVRSLTAGTGIGISGSSGAVAISNTGITSLTAGTGIGISGSSGSVTISNTGIASINAGSNIFVSGNTVNVATDPRFVASMGFTDSGTTSVFQNVVYPYGTPEYYPYMSNGAGTNVNNTIGGKQFWATNTPASVSAQVMRYRFDGIEAQQGLTGTTLSCLNFNNTTGLFSLSNMTSIDAPSGLNFNNRRLQNISTITGCNSANYMNFYTSNDGIKIATPQGSKEIGQTTYVEDFSTFTYNYIETLADASIPAVNFMGFKTAVSTIAFDKPVIYMDSDQDFIALSALNGVSIQGGLSVDGNTIGPGFQPVYGKAYVTGLTVLSTTAISMVVFDGLTADSNINLTFSQDIIQSGYSGVYRIDYEVNVEVVSITTDFTIFVRPVVVGPSFVNTPSRGGGWQSCVGPAVSAFLRVSGSDIVYYDASSDLGFALEYQVNTATGSPTPTIAFNDATVVGFAFNTVQMILTRMTD
jgi:hypothetical protein